MGAPLVGGMRIGIGPNVLLIAALVSYGVLGAQDIFARGGDFAVRFETQAPMFREGLSWGYQDKLVVPTAGHKLSPPPGQARSEPPLPPIKGKWRLTLQEEFDGPLNTNVWTDRDLWTDSSLGASLFDPANVEVRDGNLVITTREKVGKNREGKEFKYSSGLVQSFGKFTQAFGYFEIRMSLPTTRGLWPAFWLMPDRGVGDLDRWWLAGRRSTFVQTGENNGFTGKGMEIDIMEHLTIWGPDKFHAAIHWDGYGKEHKAINKAYQVPPSKDGSRIFGLCWRPNLLIWFVDNKEVHRIENARIADVPMYILINTAVGGWDRNSPDSTTKMPATTSVDWVRVWAED